jgi:hypothetical protein
MLEKTLMGTSVRRPRRWVQQSREKTDLDPPAIRVRSLASNHPFLIE